jgi:hypothetical protein
MKELNVWRTNLEPCAKLSIPNTNRGFLSATPHLKEFDFLIEGVVCE